MSTYVFAFDISTKRNNEKCLTLTSSSAILVDFLLLATETALALFPVSIKVALISSGKAFQADI